MRFFKLITFGFIALFAFAPFASLAQASDKKATPEVMDFARLDALARKRVGVQSRVALVAEISEIFQGIDGFEPVESRRVPNYLRAMANLPNAVKPMARLVKTFIYGGTLAPDLKMGMGLKIAQLHQSPYVAAHLQRFLKASERGQKLLAGLRSNELAAMPVADQMALKYAELLTGDVHGVSDEDFQKTRAYFNDSQIVELTMTVCFFNYFTRFCEALNLPVEPWAIATPSEKSMRKYQPPVARVALISDEEMSAISDVLAASRSNTSPASSLGLGIANSQRAMIQVPDMYAAWRAYGTAVREYAEVNREIKLHVSFAVSMANGCRYCTLHQVLGLRRLNVDPSKLMAMKKDDSSLTPRELTAVTFARKSTATPAGITDGDYENLKREFKEQGALEVLLQTCNFAYMNRFTDGLRLPSEDEAIKVYREIYGGDFSAK